MKTNCEYGPVENEISADRTDCGRSWTPFLRQLMVCMGMCSLYFQIGLCLGTPTVVIPRMRESKGEDYISPVMASWMSSALSYSSLPWHPILAVLASNIGRRYTFGPGVAASLVGFSLLYVGDTPQLVLGAMITQGILVATTVIAFFILLRFQGILVATTVIAFFILTEYTSPHNRGIFLTSKTATGFLGIWVANAIGTVAHWRYIAALGLVCGLYNLVTLFIWPESPFWLASKGRLDQCGEAHRWLKGYSAGSEKELQELIKSKQRLEGEYMEKRRDKTRIEKWRGIYQDLKSKYVYKSVLISLALHLQYCLSGKLVYTVYAIDIIKSITKSKSEAYKGMLILDGVTVLGMYIGCALASKMKRRTLLLSSGALSIVFLLLMSLYLYLIKFGLLQETTFMTLFLLTGFSLSVSCGPIILNMTLAAELLPLRMRSTCAAVLAVLHHFLSATNLKIAPWIFTNIGMSGAFLVYGLASAFFLVLLCIFLPETKNKTLKEIEESIVAIGTNIQLPTGLI